MIFSVPLASTRGRASEILQHGRDLTCLIHRVCCRGDESFSPRSVPLATLNCFLFGSVAISKRSTSYPVNESHGVGRTSIGLLAENPHLTRNQGLQAQTPANDSCRVLCPHHQCLSERSSDSSQTQCRGITAFSCISYYFLSSPIDPRRWVVGGSFPCYRPENGRRVATTIVDWLESMRRERF